MLVVVIKSAVVAGDVSGCEACTSEVRLQRFAAARPKEEGAL